MSERTPGSNENSETERMVASTTGMHRLPFKLRKGVCYSVFTLFMLSATTSPSFAQFEDGSFEDPHPSNEVGGGTPPPIPGGESDDGFGGSFGDSGGDTESVENDGPPPLPGDSEPTPQTVESDTPPPIPDEGDSDGLGGSFEEGSDEIETAREREDPQAPDVEEANPPPDNHLGGNDGNQPSKWAGILQFETRDFGIPPTNQLRSSQFHAPTPTSIPGGNLITTAQLANALQQGQQLIIIDVLGGSSTLPNAYSANAMASPGNFRDRIQQQTNQWLAQITSSNRQFPIVISCSDPFCWLSYNASLRAIAAGYTNVYWYRGGLQAWSMAGLSLQASGF